MLQPLEPPSQGGVLQHLSAHVEDAHDLVLVTVLLVPQKTDRELGAGSGFKHDGAWEVFSFSRS